MIDKTEDSLTDQYQNCIKAIGSCRESAALESLRVDWLGRKGTLTAEFSKLRDYPAAERSARGETLNNIKNQLLEHLSARREELKADALQSRLRSEREDMSLPPIPLATGKLHALSQTIDEVVSIFGSMGFTVAEGPDIDDDFHNFSALNFPPYHPARDAQDTFFLDHKNTTPPPRDLGQGTASPEDPDGSQNYQDILLLRTHTSTVQVRAMLNQSLPIRIIAPGRCYRRDSDITHSPMFHQVEGLYIDKNVNFGQLKYCLATFLRNYFGTPKVPLRFRPSFFPFVEPGAEVDIACQRDGKQFRVGTGGDWLEILGCGMVHPNVLRSCGIDPDQYSGFAFGMGLERIAMLKYGISDLRAFFSSNLPWLKHYGSSPFYQADIVRGLEP